MFQYVLIAICFTQGKPFRESAFSNFWFMVSVIVLLGCNVYIVLSENLTVANLFDLYYIEFGFRYLILVLVIVNFVAYWLYEHYIVSTLAKNDKTL